MADEPDRPVNGFPNSIEHHSFRYPWRQRLTELEILAQGEGETIFAARGEGARWIVHDSGTLADFLPKGDPLLDSLLKLERYDDPEGWKERCNALRVSRSKPVGPRRAKGEGACPTSS